MEERGNYKEKEADGEQIQEANGGRLVLSLVFDLYGREGKMEGKGEADWGPHTNVSPTKFLWTIKVGREGKISWSN
jgi:hypothetical protein